MSQEYAFTPQYGKGITVTPTGTSASSTLGKGLKQIVVTNASSTISYYVSVKSEATTADYLVLPKTQIVITKEKDTDTISYIVAADFDGLHIIAGEGF